MKPTRVTPFKIIFWTEEGEKNGGHNNLSAELQLYTGSDGTTAQINFVINSGGSVGKFDYERSKEAHRLSLEDAKKIKEKLEEFIKDGEEFLAKYKKN